ncbi:NADH-quinone oxidoreductase subunit C [Roseivirga sp. BDSF3-8]|uniref:NADH-quinone oxidoreductase subunit C n=1 Tax=Roseivirga sp. BDSF3-8 TaxID=3241598 RepID=UPI0035327718
MQFDNICELLKREAGQEAITATDTTSTPPTITIPPALLLSAADCLYRHPDTYFDFLSCLTALDNGPSAGTMEVIYHLYSIPFDHSVALRVEVPRPAAPGELPAVPSVSHLWKSALWHEREAFDLVGIHFEGHPDLRRILLPSDWEGHPLRKDYDEQEYYHGIEVKY